MHRLWRNFMQFLRDHAVTLVRTISLPVELPYLDRINQRTGIL